MGTITAGPIGITVVIGSVTIGPIAFAATRIITAGPIDTVVSSIMDGRTGITARSGSCGITMAGHTAITAVPFPSASGSRALNVSTESERRSISLKPQWTEKWGSTFRSVALEFNGEPDPLHLKML
jgi:hypothetical protein